ncbi:MAG: ABC transporter substrate-binding protein [Eubacteriales bacterium]|nr:ABC transporter substrate-binding protein [Eubacteriales bacterium]
MIKRISALLLCMALLVPPFIGFAQRAPVRVAALKGPTAMGLVKLMADNEETGDYKFILAASPDALVPALAKGEVDIACLPVNLAAILYQNTKGAVRVINVNTLGVIYILEKGADIKELDDLAGRKIYASGKASTPEYALTYLLEKAGVENVEVEWKADHSEALASFMSDPDGLAMLPQPFVTVAQTKKDHIRIALDLTREWEAVTGDTMITGVTVARQDFLTENPEAAARFLRDHQASASYVNAKVKDAAVLVGKYGIVDALVAEKALPYCNIIYLDGDAMETALAAFYQMLFEQNPMSVGGQVPDAAFYYEP